MRGLARGAGARNCSEAGRGGRAGRGRAGGGGKCWPDKHSADETFVDFVTCEEESIWQSGLVFKTDTAPPHCTIPPSPPSPSSPPRSNHLPQHDTNTTPSHLSPLSTVSIPITFHHDHHVQLAATCCLGVGEVRRGGTDAVQLVGHVEHLRERVDQS